MNEAEWEQRVADAWASIDERDETEFLALIETLAAELPPGSGTAAFGRAASFDSTGHSDLAVPLYRQALERGLSGERRRAGKAPAPIPTLDDQLRPAAHRARLRIGIDPRYCHARRSG